MVAECYQKQKKIQKNRSITHNLCEHMNCIIISDKRQTLKIHVQGLVIEQIVGMSLYRCT